MLPATVARDAAPRDTAHPAAVQSSRDARALARIRDADLQLAIWQRSLPQGLAAWLEDVAPQTLPHFRILVATEDVAQAIGRLVERDALGLAAPSRMLARDIEALVRLFASVARCDEVDIRLERITGDACWKFHRDHVPVRLLTTYRGPGSEWVAPEASDRALADQRAYRGPLHRLPRHAVGLFKGCADDACAGIVHRSPPIAGTGGTRLLLCLNGPTAASPPRWTG